VWKVQAWDKGTKKWYPIAKVADPGDARAAVKLIALKGRVGQALHPSGQTMRCYPALGPRPLTFSHFKPLEKDDETQAVE
jgi:hypothetical protein